MRSQIFINLPVKDLNKANSFYTQMGFRVNPAFSDDSAKCLMWSDEIYLMIMTHERFKGFATKDLADTQNTLAGLYALSVESFQKVNEVADKAVAAGGKEPKPLQDHGFMQLRTVEDPDGHTWEIFFMDMSKFPGTQNNSGQ